MYHEFLVKLMTLNKTADTFPYFFYKVSGDEWQSLQISYLRNLSITYGLTKNIFYLW